MAYTTINKSTEHFETKLWTGTGSVQSITNMNFQPAFIWWKERSSTSHHNITDAVRGVSKQIFPNRDNPETSYVGSEISSFNSDGFSIGTSSDTNQNGQTYGSWNFKAGTTSGLSGGSITPSGYSYNATSGFGIYKYSGTGSNASITHGLGKIPKMVIVKRLNAQEDWSVFTYDVNVSNNNAHNYLELNTTNAEAGDSGARWGSYANFNTNTFGVGTDNGTNASGSTYIAYVFTETVGFSKVGKYQGTGSASSTPFIYTGFKPEFVMTKIVGGADAWSMTDIPRDNAVGGGNGTGARLTANTNSAESSNTSWASIQKYSNGFSPQGSDQVTNGNEETYIYIAIGQSIVGSNKVPCTAR